MKASLIYSLPFYLGIFGLYISESFNRYPRETYSVKQLIQVFISSSIFYLLLLMIALVIFSLTCKSQKYTLSDDGFEKSRGRTIKRYSWSDFVCFWPFYSVLSNGELQNIAINISNMTGDSIYLYKKKVGKFKKTIVTIDTLPENNELIINCISQKLPQNNKVMSQWGLIKYE